MQAVGQLSYIRPYVDDFTAEWLITNSLTLTAGAMILVHVSRCWQSCTPVADWEHVVAALSAGHSCHSWVMAAANPEMTLHYTLQTADVITELKLGNGTSILIFANIASALPTSVGGAVQQVCVLLANARVLDICPAACLGRGVWP